MQSLGHKQTESGTVRVASLGDSDVTIVSVGEAVYDASIQKLLIPNIGFRLACPIQLHIEWTSGQSDAHLQQPSRSLGECASCILLQLLNSFLSVCVLAGEKSACMMGLHVIASKPLQSLSSPSFSIVALTVSLPD